MPSCHFSFKTQCFTNKKNLTTHPFKKYLTFINTSCFLKQYPKKIWVLLFYYDLTITELKKRD